MTWVLLAFLSSARFGDREGQRKNLTPSPVKIYVNGEPTYDHHVVHDYDAIFATAGDFANPKLLYVPFYMLESCKNGSHHQRFYSDQRWLTPARDRPIDVLYRSSNCNPKRESIVNHLRARVEKAGLRFEHSGACSGGSSKPRLQQSKTEDCAECYKSKMMISMSRDLEPTWEALDEKLLVPNLFGAVPIYLGKGQRLATEYLHWKTSWWMDLNNFTFPSLETIDKMRVPFPCGAACDRIRNYMKERNIVVHADTVRVYTQKKATWSARNFWKTMMKCAFGSAKTIHFVESSPDEFTDVILDQCCWW